MKVWIPEYYHNFRCIASACPDSCCKEWAVDIDDSAAALYRSLPGSLGDALRSVLKDTEDGTMMTIQTVAVLCGDRTVCAEFRQSWGTMRCARFVGSFPVYGTITVILQNTVWSFPAPKLPV